MEDETRISKVRREIPFYDRLISEAILNCVVTNVEFYEKSAEAVYPTGVNSRSLNEAAKLAEVYSAKVRNLFYLLKPWMEDFEIILEKAKLIKVEKETLMKMEKAKDEKIKKAVFLDGLQESMKIYEDWFQRLVKFAKVKGFLVQELETWHS